MSLHADVVATRGQFQIEVSLSANADETVAILGPNGSGKSTLVGALAGLIESERGRVELDGSDLTDVPPDRRPIGVLFQDRALFPHLSALENVAFPLRAHGVARPEARRRAIELLETFGVAGRAAALPRELSGGEAQRVALARALISEPRLLLLDEPSSALDVEARGRFRAVLAGILRSFPGVRVLVTHDPIEAMTLADRLVLMERGRITQSGTPDEIRRAPRTSYAAEVVGVNLFAGRLERLPDGAGRLVTSDGELTVGWPQGAPDPLDDVVAILRPIDVAMHRSMPEGSARNVLRGTVSEIAIDGERARVRVRSTPPVVAEITVGSVERLGIREESDVWVSFKAVEVRVVQPLEPAAGTLGG